MLKGRFISLTTAGFHKIARKFEIQTEIEQYSVHGPLQAFAFKTWKKSTFTEIYFVYSKLNKGVSVICKFLKRFNCTIYSVRYLFGVSCLIAIIGL